MAAPPGSAKSTYVSVLFIAWYLANHPAHAVIAASHTSELAEKWGRRVRNSIAEHGLTLGLALRPDTAAAGRWACESGAEYLAAGVGQAILGYRGDLIVIDDPIRSKEDASSEVVRKSTWEWFSTDLKTRLKPGGRLVIISTRWHTEDLPGRLLREAEEGGEKWDTLILPAIAEQDDPIGREPGEYLWSDSDNYDYSSFLKREHETQSAMNWSALYQQRPAPETGDFFKLEWLKPYELMPERKTLRVYVGTDFAITRKGGDFTVFVVVGMDPARHLYLLDLYRKQEDPGVWVEDLLSLQRKWNPIAVAVEKGQIAGTVGPFLERRRQERKIPIFLRPFASKHDKSTRAQSIRGFMSLNGLYTNPKAQYYSAFVEELLSFPAGRHDDIVDALGLIGQLFDIVQPGNIVRPEANKYDPRRDPYRVVDSAEMLESVVRDPEFHLHTDDYDGPSFLTM